jgi:hypothetical protein
MITKENFNKLMSGNKETHHSEVQRNLTQCKGALMEAIKMRNWAISKLDTAKYDKYTAMEIMVGRAYDKLEDQDYRMQAEQQGERL